MSQKLKHTKETQSPELVFSGINYSAGLLAMAALHAGVKVGFLLNNQPDTSFEPELTAFYPSTYREIPGAVKEVRFMQACSSLFPHLFFPQRCLFFNRQQRIDTRLNALFDTLTGRDRDQAALVVKTADVPGLAIPGVFPEKVALVGEYRIDRNMAGLELLGLCLEKGARVLDQNQVGEARQVIHCMPSRLGHINFEYPGMPFPWQNPMRIQCSAFSLLIHKNIAGTQVDLLVIGKNSAFDFLDEVNALLLRLLPHIGPISSEQLRGAELTTDQTSGYVLADENLSQMRKNLLLWQTNLRRKFSKNIDIEKMLKELGKVAIDGEQFRRLQNECDAQFGLARQTGITFEHFSFLFYRYRTLMDEMIEEAYTLMAEIRDPAVLWKQVEQNTLKSFLEPLNFKVQ